MNPLCPCRSPEGHTGCEAWTGKRVKSFYHFTLQFLVGERASHQKMGSKHLELEDVGIYHSLSWGLLRWWNKMEASETPRIPTRTNVKCTVGMLSQPRASQTHIEITSKVTLTEDELKIKINSHKITKEHHGGEGWGRVSRYKKWEI